MVRIRVRVGDRPPSSQHLCLEVIFDVSVMLHLTPFSTLKPRHDAPWNAPILNRHLTPFSTLTATDP